MGYTTKKVREVSSHTAYATPAEPKRENHADLTDAEFADLMAQYRVEKAEYDEAQKGFTGK